MNFEPISQGAKVDIISTVLVVISLVVVAFALELSAPVLAGAGAIGAAVTGIGRLFYQPKKKRSAARQRSER